MRTVGITLIALVCGFAGVANADSKVVVKTTTYPVTGNSGREIMRSMFSGGPTQGLQARAMAATRYDVKWDMDWDKNGGTCRLKGARATLFLTYNFPKLASRVSPDLQSRWTKFMAGVRTHEQHHGQLAQDMVKAAESSVVGMTNANDPGCTRTQNEARRHISSIYAQYEARQRAFDAKEHQRGGNVDALVAGLVNRG
ncbi:putative secreted Zn-dependent protease [Mesorhizobium soli]|jgi:predicted secreted Zn-dependent protease|uniref:DUF922 domain-containing protein n=1 Tax=Pseudaminobacter soli (ex Li et al. 2025) TaxID=1295366 RepID=UPI002473705D|nr:DUF922 domain-containing protein [Mesorhizobium soli]MDH6230041.1 putative secreted Zn-dependent protease [Mesorhizobium soli]